LARKSKCKDQNLGNILRKVLPAFQNKGGPRQLPHLTHPKSTRGWMDIVKIQYLDTCKSTKQGPCPTSARIGKP